MTNHDITMVNMQTGFWTFFSKRPDLVE